MEAGSAQVLGQLTSGDFTNLVSACEELELLLQEELPEEPSPEQIEQMGLLYAIHLLAYLLEGQLSAARFLWKRTPQAAQEHPQAVAAHDALAACWRRRHGEYFSKLQAIAGEERLQLLVVEVAKRSRSRLLDQIGNAYKNITMDSVAGYLGLDATAARAACEECGWTVDAAGSTSPVRAKAKRDMMQMNEEQLRKLAEYVAYLEQPACRI